MSVVKNIESQIRKALYHYQMLNEGDKIIIALSGGKDSLTLMHMLDRINGRGFPTISLHAVHISGAYSCGAGVDLNFLQNVCDSLSVPLSVIETHQDLETLECYSCARERRRLLFNKAKELGSRTVAFGHHRDDHVQTLLMNLLHKGEFSGNHAKVPMIKYGVTIIRPMIYVAENDIISAAQTLGFHRVMCRCPVGQKSMRRKAEELLRDIETLFPNARTNLAQAGWNQGSDKALTP